MCCGRTPYQTMIQGKKTWKEKFLNRLDLTDAAGKTANCQITPDPLQLVRFLQHVYKPQCRTHRGLEGRLGIGCIVFLPFHEGLDVSRRNEPHVMAQLADLDSRNARCYRFP